MLRCVLCSLCTEHVDCHARYEEMVAKCQVFVLSFMHFNMIEYVDFVSCVVTTMTQGAVREIRVLQQKNAGIIGS